MTTTKPLTTAQTKATTSDETACRASPDDALDASARKNRNTDKTLPEALQTFSQTARRNASFSDPVMLESGLRPFGTTPVAGAPAQCAVWQAHHLLSVAEVQDPRYRDLFAAAAKAGWSIDETANVIGLPTEPNAQRMLHNTNLPGADRPIHDNAHHVGYKREVVVRPENLDQRLTETRHREGSPQYDQFARTPVEEGQTKLRDNVLSHRLGRLTSIEPSRTIKETSAANPWNLEIERLRGKSAPTPLDRGGSFQEALAQKLWHESLRQDVSATDVLAVQAPARSPALRL